MATATTNESGQPQENFAALFEESLARQEMRQGELITAEVTRVDYNIVVVNAGLKSESFIPIEEFKNERAKSRSRPATSSPSPSRALKTATARPGCRATRPSASRRGRISKPRWSRAMSSRVGSPAR